VGLIVVDDDATDDNGEDNEDDLIVGIITWRGVVLEILLAVVDGIGAIERLDDEDDEVVVVTTGALLTVLVVLPEIFDVDGDLEATDSI
jgi:hypothetical protein